MQQLDLTAIGESPTDLLGSIILVEELIPNNSLFLNTMCNKLFNPGEVSVINGNHAPNENHGDIVRWTLTRVRYKIRKTNKSIIIVLLEKLTDTDIQLFDMLAINSTRNLFVY